MISVKKIKKNGWYNLIHIHCTCSLYLYNICRIFKCKIIGQMIKQFLDAHEHTYYVHASIGLRCLSKSPILKSIRNFSPNVTNLNRIESIYLCDFEWYRI